MIFQISAYLKFLARSTNQHGVHSPFVFSLVTQCFYDRKKYAVYDLLQKYRTQLEENHTIISVSDFGSGSKIFKSNQRKVSAIAKTAGIKSKNAKLLYRLAAYLEPKSILEIGTSLGMATAALALGAKNGTITSVEGCPETAAIALKNLQDLKISNISVRCDSFENFLSRVENQQFDFVYFDGNHTQEATLKYFHALLPTITNDTCWIFDDIYWSADMQQAWQKIVNHPKVTVSIDTFQWGIVFFRSEQQKEHFTIRT